MNECPYFSEADGGRLYPEYERRVLAATDRANAAENRAALAHTRADSYAKVMRELVAAIGPHGLNHVGAHRCLREIYVGLKAFLAAAAALNLPEPKESPCPLCDQHPHATAGDTAATSDGAMQ